MAKNQRKSCHPKELKMDLLKVISAEYVSDHKMSVTFNNRSKLICDLFQSVQSGVFQVLQDKAKFKNFTVIDGVVEWPGELDIAPEYLYKIGTAVQCNTKLPEPDYVSWTG
jgi:hypothetical protein